MVTMLEIMVRVTSDDLQIGVHDSSASPEYASIISEVFDYFIANSTIPRLP